MGHHLKGHHGKKQTQMAVFLTKVIGRRRLSGRRKKSYTIIVKKIKELLSDDKEKKQRH